ncbi:MAG TPA: hypothetical protein VGM92_06325, partial [Candidatus Kapabacteria bacterium]
MVTRPYYYADSYEYAHSILNHIEGKPAPLFWESGHFLWRPIGTILYDLFHPVARVFVGNSSFALVSAILLFTVLLLTAVGIFFFYRFLRLFPISEMAVQIGVLFYVVSGCVLNYSQTATSYQAGLSILIVAVYYNAVGPDSPKVFQIIRNSILLALPPLLWLPYVLVLPAVVLARPLVYGWNRLRVKNSFYTGFFCVIAAICLLSPVIFRFHLFTYPAFMHWAFYDWGLASNVGPIRTIFGLPKALFYLG